MLLYEIFQKFDLKITIGGMDCYDQDSSLPARIFCPSVLRRGMSAAVELVLTLAS